MLAERLVVDLVVGDRPASRDGHHAVWTAAVPELRDVRDDGGRSVDDRRFERPNLGTRPGDDEVDVEAVERSGGVDEHRPRPGADDIAARDARTVDAPN